MRCRTEWGTTALIALALASCAAPSDPELAAIPTWDSFLAASTRQFEGRTIYVVEGDMAVSLAELRAEYDRRVGEAMALAAGEGVGRSEQESTVNRFAGADDLWPVTARRDLRYCVSDDFGADKARTIAEMAVATADWERHGNFNFRYVPAEDATCTGANPDVVFAVRPWASSGACAFFPSGDACVARTLVMNYASFAVGPVTSQGVFRHELGHVLGLRHEHIRAPGTFCTEDSSWRAVTPYDSSSVMHYPDCPGATNTGDLVITPNDAAGIVSLYGPSSAHGFAWVNGPGLVSPTYSYNSQGGTITAAPGSLPGTIAVTFGGLGGIGGDVQVVGYGPSNTRCKVAAWGGNWPGDLTVIVQCNQFGGAAVVAPFVVQYARKATRVDGVGAYVWANEPSNPTYCPLDLYSWNSADGQNCISHTLPGIYGVRFPDVGTWVGGTVQVTAYGTSGEHCKVQGWGPTGTGQLVTVRCFDAAGLPADTRFTVNLFGNREVSVRDYGGYAWANNPTSPLYTPIATWSYDSGEIDGWPGCVGWLGDIQAGHFADFAGHYFLRYQFLSPLHSAAHATAYGTTSSYCKVENWGPSADGTEVRVQCYAADGTKQDNQYVGTYASSFFRGPC